MMLGSLDRPQSGLVLKSDVHFAKLFSTSWRVQSFVWVKLLTLHGS
jgi:hypothetical protein